ncbi:hypothetical protein RQP46_009789 [Phenoliferia psychrophenolica]
MSTSTSPATPLPVPSEDVLSAKTDLCLSNALVKSSIGLGAGVVLSAILFRRRPWPVLMGLGFGIGQGYSDCERVFNPAAVPGFVIAGQDPKSATAPYAKFNPFASSTASDVKAKAAEVKAEVVEKAKDVKDAVVAKKDDKKVV